MTAAPANYNPLDQLPSGQVLTQERIDLILGAYAAGGYQIMTDAQIVALVGPAIPMPTSIGPDYWNGEAPPSVSYRADAQGSF